MLVLLRGSVRIRLYMIIMVLVISGLVSGALFAQDPPPPVATEEPEPPPPTPVPEVEADEVSIPDPNSDDIVERGAYLVRIEASCVACHGGDGYEEDPLGIPLSGGRRMDTHFGVVYGPNLTVLQNWSDQEIEHAIRYGVRPDGMPLLPSMPYNLHANMADPDMEAIIAYLRSLEPVASDVPEPEFFEGFTRETVRTVPEFDPDAEFDYPEGIDDDPLVRGTYMATTTSRCLMCHGTPDETGFQADPDLPATGLLIPTFPALLADKVEHWSDDDIRWVFGELGLFEMPTFSFQYLPDDRVDALIAWLRSQPYAAELEEMGIEFDPDVDL
jgi:mono/diheme cytochrome c family protein